MEAMSPDRPSVDAMTWWEFVQRAAGEDNNSVIARKLDISQSAVSRWSSGGRVDPAQAARFARSYGRPVLEAFVAAGFLTPEEARERPVAAPSLATLTDDDLLAEVRRRMQGGQYGRAAADAEKNNVTPIHGATHTPDTMDTAAWGHTAPGRLQAELDEQRGEESQDPGE